MNIKGQNFRAFIDGKCVAAATSCQVHVAAQIESVSTKDSEGDFEENECVGKSWDASVDALLPDHGDRYGVAECQDESKRQGEYFSALIQLQAGDCILAVDENANPVVVYSSTLTPLYSNTDGYICYTAASNINVYIATLDEEADINYDIYARATGFLQFLHAIENGELIQFKFSTVTGAAGSKNRVEDDEFCSGEGYVTDLSVNASNRQRVNYSLKISGDGELDF